MSRWALEFEPPGALRLTEEPRTSYAVTLRPPFLEHGRVMALIPHAEACATSPCRLVFEIPDEWGCATVAARTIVAGDCWRLDADGNRTELIRGFPIETTNYECDPTHHGALVAWTGEDPFPTGACVDRDPVPEPGLAAGLLIGAFWLALCVRLHRELGRSSARRTRESRDLSRGDAGSSRPAVAGSRARR